MTTRRVNDKRHYLTRNPVFYHFTNPLSSKKFTSVVLHESESLRFEIFFSSSSFSYSFANASQKGIRATCKTDRSIHDYTRISRGE